MTTDYASLGRRFVAAFNTKDAGRLAPFLHSDVVFLNYGDNEVRGREAVLGVWEGVFRNFERVEFEIVHQAVNDNVVLAEQVHGLALPGGPLAPVMNLAVYEFEDDRIVSWRDYSNPEYARKLLTA
jgi:limonene-1,2-epoxide hydrolase